MAAIMDGLSLSPLLALHVPVSERVSETCLMCLVSSLRCFQTRLVICLLSCPYAKVSTRSVDVDYTQFY